MSTRLSRTQLALMGLVVAVALALGVTGLAALAAKERLWGDTVEVMVGLTDAADVTPGTPVRIRGVDAGHVTAINDSSDAAAAPVLVKVRLDGRYRGRLYADATAKVMPLGLLGGKVLVIVPGTPAKGLLADGYIAATPTADISAAAEKLAKVADEAEKLLADVRSGKGTLAKLVNDDTLHRELTALVTDARAATGKVEAQAANVSGLVVDGRETLKSVKQNTDAIQKMPLIRGYVENAAAILVRPECRKQVYDYRADDLFEPGTAILTADGRKHLANLAEMMRAANAEPAMAQREYVVAAMLAADDPMSAAAAAELTRKQAEGVAEVLKDLKVHKTGVWHRNRPVAALGLAHGPNPIPDAPAGPIVQVVVFRPAN
jgi:hypothetical protein